MRNTFEIVLSGEKVHVRLDENLYRIKHIWDCRRHNNAGFELHIILGGECDMNVAHKQFKIKKHQAIIIAPGKYHQPASLNGSFERFSCSFSMADGLLFDLLSETVSSSILFDITDEMANLCSSIFRECASGKTFRQDMIQSLLATLILCAFRQINLAGKSEKDSFPISDSEQMILIDTFFEMNMAEDASAEMLAQQLHLTRRQLERILKRNYGMGFRQKLINSRMDLAAWQLISTNKNVSDIACEVGYSSGAAFYQAFRNQFEMTPTKYRSEFRQNETPLWPEKEGQ